MEITKLHDLKCFFTIRELIFKNFTEYMQKGILKILVGKIKLYYATHRNINRK